MHAGPCAPDLQRSGGTLRPCRRGLGHNGGVQRPENPVDPTREMPAPQGGTAQAAPAGWRTRLSRRWQTAARDSQMPRPVLATSSLVLLCLMVLGISLMPVPYVIEQPGPAIDVLGEYKGARIISIDGAKTYPTDGQLMMTTVSVDGGPGYDVTPVEVLTSWFRPSHAVMPRELLFAPSQTKQETQLANTVQMTTSQQTSVAAALDELDIDYTTTVFIAGVLQGSPADGVLQAGDVVTAVNGSTAEDPAGFQRLAQQTPPGQKVAVTVRRAGKNLDLQVPTEEADGKARMGISLARGYSFPMDVKIAVGDVGGPSAGMIFALSVYDELTPGALTGGRRIAGTGTIDAAAKVGPIGGIRQKLVGARDTGAEYFLAPQANCGEVAGHIPDGLQVVSVATFEDALRATETIAETGSTRGLPTCEVP